MATNITKVTEPALPELAVDKVAEPSTPELPTAKVAEPLDPRKSVQVYDTRTGKKLDRPVPENWLDGRFPHLKETPSQKAGK